MIEEMDIINNLNTGRVIFENVPDNLKPFWSGLILSRFNNYVKNIPDSIKELYQIIENENRWTEAYVQFSKIRQFVLDNKYDLPNSYLLLAEKTAKVTYNASGQSAPFDANSGWYISSLALQIANYFENDRLKEEVKVTVLLFNGNKKFKSNIQAAKDFLIHRKIDEILRFDWNPIGLNNVDDPSDEYISYVSEIFRLKKSGASRKEIAKCLLNIEIERMGFSGAMEDCLVIADKIIGVSY